MTPELVALIARCRAAAPELDVEPSAFAAKLEACRPAELAPAEWYARAFADDLYLALACETGAAAALRLFAQRFARDLDHVLRGRDNRGLDDARQILFQRLFAGPRPKIATYTGRAPLRRWLRVVASRLLLEILADREPLADERELAELPVADDDPELAHLKARYRAEYKAAFAEALARTTDRDRVLLSQYHVDDLTIDQLGALYSIHRATASRWIARAQRELRERVIARLRERLGASTTELRSLTRLVRSRLELSLSHVLKADRAAS